MKGVFIKYSTVLLQAIIVIVGVGVFVFLLSEPYFEGRNVNATLFEIYFKDLFLAYAYVAFIPFFVALCQIFKVLGYIGHSTVFSIDALRALQTIKYCGGVHASLIAGAVVYLFIFERGKDDIAGGVAMGLFITLVSVVIATTAAVFERRVRGTLDM